MIVCNHWKMSKEKEREIMNLKRIATALIGLPFVILLITLGNVYVMDVVISIIAIVAMYEFANCISKEAKFISWVG